jgi:glycosyltransferase involved in cell wall biosynthesis
MNVQPIKISVGMPVYNGETYLEDAIKSVLNQTYGDFELIISDNASTDRTEEICRDFACKDKRVTYIRNSENIGAANNYNQLFRKSSGEYFRWFNADDLCSDRYHEKCLAILEAHPDAAVCYGKTAIIDGQGALIELYDDKMNLQEGSAFERFKKFLNVCGLTNIIYGLMRRSALAKTMLMGDGTFPAADTNLMAELAMHGKIIEIPETLFSRRMHEQASSWDRKNQAVQQEFWKGNNSKFIMPTLKRHLALLHAISNSSATWPEKLAIKKLVIIRIVWARDTIAHEFLQMLMGKNG